MSDVGLSTVILGIESSCDETAAAVVVGGHEVRSSVVSSQIDLHARFGGVVPEVASRAHVERIVPVIVEAMGEAGIEGRDLDAVAATYGPGLVGALLVIPAAAARLLSQSLKGFFWLSVLIATFCTLIGVFLPIALELPVPSGASIIIMAGIVFAVAAIARSLLPSLKGNLG